MQINSNKKKMMGEEILSNWRALQLPTLLPPSKPVILLQTPSGTIFVDDAWGPSIPYHPVDHGNGTQNYGYISLKDNPEEVKRLPELQNFPEFSAFIVAANASDSLIESVGCEKSFFEVENMAPVTTKLGSYTDFIFSIPDQNENPENLLLLAAYFFRSAKGCERWWSQIEIGLARFRYLHGVNEPWGLHVKVTGFGRDEAEARAVWRATLGKLTIAAGKLNSWDVLLTDS